MPRIKTGDTALMMAARTGKWMRRRFLDHGAQVNAKETWGGTTALMWAVSERHPEVVQLLVEHGADVNAKSNFVPSASGRGFEGTAPVAAQPNQTTEEFASGWMTPLMFAAREDDMESARFSSSTARMSMHSGATVKTLWNLLFSTGATMLPRFSSTVTRT